jgi:hypothetical protein
MKPMARRKRWYDREAALAIRVISHSKEEEAFCAERWRHPRVRPKLGECLAYPLIDGPGLGLLILLPPLMFMLSLPIFDVVAVLQPLTKGNWALGLLIVPVMVPLTFSFAMTFGYALLFLGHVLVSSSLGENDHPRWPEWHPGDIAEGVCRWVWAGIFGGALGGAPLAYYWLHCGEIDWIDWVVCAELAALGAGYALLALAAALLHDNIFAANPITVISAVVRIGWSYLPPCLLAGVAMGLIGLGAWSLLYAMPSMWMESLGLWGFWLFFFYAAMVVLRMMGLTYHARALDLHWFRRRPQWATSARHGRIYANS